MLKLSEAMRLGAMVTKPLLGGLIVGPPDAVRTCALGAALYAVGAFTETRDPRIPEEWTILRERFSTGTVQQEILRLNDTVGWTREQIADWVESIEREMGAEKPAEVRELVEV